MTVIGQVSNTFHLHQRILAAMPGQGTIKNENQDHQIDQHGATRGMREQNQDVIEVAGGVQGLRLILPLKQAHIILDLILMATVHLEQPMFHKTDTQYTTIITTIATLIIMAMKIILKQS